MFCRDFLNLTYHDKKFLSIFIQSQKYSLNLQREVCRFRRAEQKIKGVYYALLLTN